MLYLLDTNVCITLLRRRDAPQRLRVVERLSAFDPAEMVLCSVVRQELLAGVYESKRRKFANDVTWDLIDSYASLPFDDGAAEVAARIQHELYRTGRPIGVYDMQIAAIGLHHGLTVVTHNVSHFARVPGLAIEDWEV